MYGIDTRPPGVARNARLEGDELRFKTPGDDWYGGRVDRYVVQFVHRDGSADRDVVAGSRAGAVKRIDLQPKTRFVRVRAFDEAGNVGAWQLARR